MYAGYEFDLLVVQKKILEKHGSEYKYSVRPGNNCVWVSAGRTESYWIVREGKIVDVIYD